MKKSFQPDYHNLLQVVENTRPHRLPLYEHHIDAPFISRVLGKDVKLQGSSAKDYEAYYQTICRFWQDMTYDGLDFEAAICGHISRTRCNYGRNGRPDSKS